MVDQTQQTRELLQSASVAGLRRLLRAGVIDAPQFDSLRARLLPAAYWLALTQRALLGLGAALVVAGVIFLFAFNWQAIGRFTKLGSLAAAIAGCAVAAAWRGRSTLAGKVLTTMAAALVGVFLAVFGQIYQTGADAYELFVGWAALILPWVLVAEFTTLWVLWFALVNAAALMFWHQVAEPEGRLSLAVVYGLTAAADCGLLALRELWARRGVRWLQQTWARYVAVSVVLYLLTLPVLDSLFLGRWREASSAGPLLLWLVGVAALAFAFARVLPDIFVLSLVVVDVCVVIDCLIGRTLFESTRDEVSAFFVLAVVTLGMFAGAGVLLRRLHRQLVRRSGDPA